MHQLRRYRSAISSLYLVLVSVTRHNGLRVLSPTRRIVKFVIHSIKKAASSGCRFYVAEPVRVVAPVLPDAARDETKTDPDENGAGSAAPIS